MQLVGGIESRRPRAIGALALVLATVAALPTGAAAGTPEEEFCEGGTLTDYAAPLYRLPVVRVTPGSGRLPFGPRRLSFGASSNSPRYASGEEGVKLGGEPIAYWLRLSGARFGGVQLDWEVESRLVRIDRRGRDLRLVKRRLERVNLLEVGESVEIGFRRSPGSGLYRYDLLFRDGDGNLLGHFHDHYRVVRRVVDLRLSLFMDSLLPGDRVTARIENHGTTHLFYGAGLDAERYDNGVWVSANAEFSISGFVPMIGLGVASGMIGRCSFLGFSIPEGAAPGLYRAVKQLGSRTLAAEFSVLPPA